MLEGNKSVLDVIRHIARGGKFLDCSHALAFDVKDQGSRREWLEALHGAHIFAINLDDGAAFTNELCLAFSFIANACDKELSIEQD